MTEAVEEIAGYERFEHEGRVALMRHEYAHELGSLFFGAGLGFSLRRSSGRGSVYTFDIPDGRGILRPYRRGGVLARFREDTYRENRPFNELTIHQYAYTHALAVPEPLGVIWERRGNRYSGAIATRIIKAQTLEQWAQRLPPDDEVDLTMERTGRVIREMHSAGIYHADLQIRNILVNDEGVYLIDFDNAHEIDPFADVPRARNLLRLRRSIRKNGLPNAYYEKIRANYGDIRISPALAAAYRAKGFFSDLIPF